MHTTVTAPAPLRDHDHVVLQLLQLAAEAILANPRVVPPLLYEQCSTWADDLASALSPPGPGTIPDPPHRHQPTRDSLLQAGARARN